MRQQYKFEVLIPSKSLLLLYSGAFLIQTILNFEER